MPVRKVEVFETSDGVHFDSEAEALRHEEQIQLREWFDENVVYCDRASDFEDVVRWLLKNEVQVKRILRAFG